MAQIIKAVDDHGIDELTFAAVAAQETGGPSSDNGANTPLGIDGHGHGLFQIDDGSWPTFALSAEANDPAKNAEFAAQILQGDLTHNNGDIIKALAEYNSGSSNAAKTTQTLWGGTLLYYPDSVMRHLSNLKLHDANLACGTS